MFGTGRKDGTDRQKTVLTTQNIVPPVQHRLIKHKNDLGYCFEVAALRQSDVTKEFYINDASQEKVTFSQSAT